MVAVFEAGDLILYGNPQRMIPLTVGIVIREHHGVSVESRFFWVLVPSGKQQLISEHYLTVLGAKLEGKMVR
jgi:hypothetical protein